MVKAAPEAGKEMAGLPVVAPVAAPPKPKQAYHRPYMLEIMLATYHAGRMVACACYPRVCPVPHR